MRRATDSLEDIEAQRASASILGTNAGQRLDVSG
jgi:hypothetical protein